MNTLRYTILATVGVLLSGLFVYALEEREKRKFRGARNESSEEENTVW